MLFDLMKRALHTLRAPAVPRSSRCPICERDAHTLDAVDFNKSCVEVYGTLPAGIAVRYDLCEECGFCFAPEFAHWTRDDFARRIYNAEYVTVDPDYTGVRPRANAQLLMNMFGEHVSRIRHLDYGGGTGLMSAILRDAAWQSTSYDVFADGGGKLPELGKFDLITSFEVFEHVVDGRRLVADLSSLLSDDGLILFSTLLSDGNIAHGRPLEWWYAAPRNGHISLYSRKSLAVLAARSGLRFATFSPDLHAYWRSVPEWARRLLH